MNSAAVTDPDLINRASDKYGSQCIVVAIDAKAREDGSGWDVYTRGGRHNTGIDAVAWAEDAARRGAGEILLTSMDRDGTKIGFNLDLTRAVAEAVPVPVIASGGRRQSRPSGRWHSGRQGQRRTRGVCLPLRHLRYCRGQGPHEGPSCPGPRVTKPIMALTSTFWISCSRPSPSATVNSKTDRQQPYRQAVRSRHGQDRPKARRRSCGNGDRGHQGRTRAPRRGAPTCCISCWCSGPRPASSPRMSGKS